MGRMLRRSKNMFDYYKRRLLILLIVMIIAIFLLPFGFSNPKDFNEAKKILTQGYKIGGLNTDFYCNAPFEITHDGIKVIESYAYTPRLEYTRKGNINQRARHIEFEHIMPAQNFGRHLQCWREGGRAACKRDSTFNKMEADPYNLVPAIGEINSDRSNFRYAEAPRNLVYNQYGECEVYTDFENRRFYPANYSKGLIARTYLYMSEKYHIRISPQEQRLMEAWDKQYPPNEYEIKRNRIIKIAMWIHGLKEIFRWVV